MVFAILSNPTPARVGTQTQNAAIVIAIVGRNHVIYRTIPAQLWKDLSDVILENHPNLATYWPSLNVIVVMIATAGQDNPANKLLSAKTLAGSALIQPLAKTGLSNSFAIGTLTASVGYKSPALVNVHLERSVSGPNQVQIGR